MNVMLERWQGDRLWSQLARVRSCWTLELHPFPIKPIAPKYCQAKRKSLVQPSNVVFVKRGWRCWQWLHHARAAAGQTPHPQLVQQRCSQLNITQVSFFFLVGESASLTSGWVQLHTVFHLLSCWSSGCRLRAQQMALRGDLHMQSILEITWVTSTEMELIQSTPFTKIHLHWYKIKTKQATVRNVYGMHFQN